MRARTFVAPISALLALTFVAADETPLYALDQQECVAAYEQAQLLRSRSQLRAAKEQLLVCTQNTCPKIITRDCTQWLSEIEADTATIVLSARDEHGRELTQVRVKADGVKLLDSLDGKAISIDPGPHVLRFEGGPQQSVEEKLVIHQGERNRSVTVVLSTGQEAPVSPTSARTVAPEPSKTLPVVATAVGALGLGSFAYFGLTGRAEVGRLRTQCAPQCAQSDVNAAHTKLLIADASLGVGIVSLGIATWLFLAHGQADGKQPKALVSVQPTAKGGAAELWVRF
jgi:hypothetical protein